MQVKPLHLRSSHNVNMLDYSPAIIWTSLNPNSAAALRSNYSRTYRADVENAIQVRIPSISACIPVPHWSPHSVNAIVPIADASLTHDAVVLYLTSLPMTGQIYIDRPEVGELGDLSASICQKRNLSNFSVLARAAPVTINVPGVEV